ncbi:MAG: universal stress protein [Coriobacteriia bacterium]|nr:universal stress protein [Coriobacteriia bacterium]
MKILVATDLSEAGLLSIQALIGCNPKLFRGVTLLHVFEVEDYMLGASVPDAVEWSKKRLAEEAANLVEAGFVADYRLEQGAVPEVVQEVAAETGADLIVVTDRGEGGAPGRFLGSTATRIAQVDGTPPVLVVRVEERDATWCRVGEGSPFVRPLIAADVDQTFERLVRVTAALPGVEATRIVHVVAPDDDADQARGFMEAVMERAGLSDAQAVVVEGTDPAADIITESSMWQASLIVLAPRRHGLIGRLVFGSVAISLLRDSRLPLLFA